MNEDNATRAELLEVLAKQAVRIARVEAERDAAKSALLEMSMVVNYVEEHGYADHRYVSDDTMEQIRIVRTELRENAE